MPGSSSVLMAERRTRRAPCPKCDRGRKDTALAITHDERGIVSYCHRCRYTEHDNMEVAAGSSPAPTKLEPDPERLASIWRRTRPLRGTLGETYLEHRRCVLPPADGDLRYLPATDRYPPSLCALITHAVTGAPLSLHFTRLAADGRGKATGTDEDRRYLGGHPTRGGCIRLWPDEALTHGLGMAEGIETALCAAHAYTPVWSTMDAGHLARFPVLAGVESLVIYADHDEAGMRAAQACARRWHEAGRDVRVLRSPTVGHDVADEVAA